MRKIIFGLLVSLGLMACGSSDTDDGMPYQLGDTIATSEIAAIISSDLGADTLFAEDFATDRARIGDAMPNLFSDTAQMETYFKAYVEQLVNQHIWKGEAARRDVTASEDQVTQAFMQFRGRFPSDSAFQAFLSQQRFTEARVRKEIGLQLSSEAFLNDLRNDMPDPSNAEVETYRQEQASQIQAQHILLNLAQDADAETTAAVRARAEALIDSLRAGADFSELARRHSEGPSGPQGGDLGFFQKGTMVAPFSEAAWALAEIGDFSQEPVRTQFGFHLIRLMDRQTAELMNEEAARNALKQANYQQFMLDTMTDLRKSVTVHLNPEMIDPIFLQPPAE